MPRHERGRGRDGRGPDPEVHVYRLALFQVPIKRIEHLEVVDRPTVAQKLVYLRML